MCATVFLPLGSPGPISSSTNSDTAEVQVSSNIDALRLSDLGTCRRSGHGAANEAGFAVPSRARLAVPSCAALGRGRLAG